MDLTLPLVGAVAHMESVLAAAPGPEFEGFDPDEILMLIAFGAITAAGLFRLVLLSRYSNLGSPTGLRSPIYAAIVVGFALLAKVVWSWADPVIPQSAVYTLIVFFMGGAWLTLALGWCVPWIGVSLRLDVFEQRNPAAANTLAGAILGVMFTISGSNTGEGPSFWNNVFSGLLATGSLLFLWFLVALAGGSSASIAEHRDRATGWRIAALLVAWGLILGRAIAGDWESTGATVRDFALDGWPVVVLAVVAVLADHAFRPSRLQPQPPVPSHGFLPALLYLAAAAGWCVNLGWWPMRGP